MEHDENRSVYQRLTGWKKQFSFPFSCTGSDLAKSYYKKNIYYDNEELNIDFRILS